MANPRASDELRPLHFETDYVLYPAGSVLVSMGNTKVLCTASVDESLPRWLRYSSSRHGWVTAEYAMLPGSTQKRTPREGAVPRGRTQEIKRLIGRSLRAAVDLTLLGERQIIVDCDVLQADGGTRTASINGGFVALALACRRLVAKGVIAENPVKRTIAAVSVGMVGGDAYLDLDYRLDLAADVDFNVVMTDDERFVEVQGTAEGEPYDRNELDWMLELAATGVRQIVAAQRQVLANVHV
ncbi:MAG: ribonuclease PH [Caldilineaceae bacterium]